MQQTSTTPSWVRRSKLTDDVNELATLISQAKQFRDNAVAWYDRLDAPRLAQLNMIQDWTDLETWRRRALRDGDLQTFIYYVRECQSLTGRIEARDSLQPGAAVQEYIDIRAVMFDSRIAAARTDADSAAERVIELAQRFTQQNGPRTDDDVREWVSAQRAFIEADRKCLQMQFSFRLGAVGKLCADAQRKHDRLRSESQQPEDMTAYRPASEFLDENITTYKQLRAILDRNAEIRTHKPSQQRLLIHAGDWQQWRVTEDAKAADAVDDKPEVIEAFLAEARERQATIRRRKPPQNG
jgi:hypothetical protein